MSIICFCKHHGNVEFVISHLKDGREKRVCKQCKNEGIKRLRRNNKLTAVKLLGGKCVLCGYSKCLESLHFHHLDPSNKISGPARIGSQTEKFIKEIKKCILLCANCHSEVENKITKIPEYLLDKK